MDMHMKGGTKMELKINLDSFYKIRFFVIDACTFDSDIDIYKETDHNLYDAKMFMDVMNIDRSKPLTVRINSTDKEEIEMFKDKMKKYA